MESDDEIRVSIKAKDATRCQSLVIPLEAKADNLILGLLAQVCGLLLATRVDLLITYQAHAYLLPRFLEVLFKSEAEELYRRSRGPGRDDQLACLMR